MKQMSRLMLYLILCLIHLKPSVTAVCMLKISSTSILQVVINFYHWLSFIFSYLLFIHNHMTSAGSYYRSSFNENNSYSQYTHEGLNTWRLQELGLACLCFVKCETFINWVQVNHKSMQINEHKESRGTSSSSAFFFYLFFFNMKWILLKDEGERNRP